MPLRVGSSGLDHEMPAISGAPTTPVSKLSIKHVAQQRRGEVVAVYGRMRRVVDGPLVYGDEPTAQ